MATDWNPKIRAAAAGNRMLSAADMDWLSFDAEEIVRAWVLRNPQVSLEVVQRMAETDTSPSIRQYAKFLLTHRFNVE